MNLIQRQADDFLEEVLDERRGDHKEFIGQDERNFGNTKGTLIKLNSLKESQDN